MEVIRAVSIERLAAGLGPDVVRQLGALWGKSAGKAGGRANLLMSHLLDTAAVAGQIWDHYLAPSTRAMLDEVAGGQGRGRRFFAWLCGVHDCGKASPAFQAMDEPGARAVRQAGLGWDSHVVGRHRWRHDKAGAKLIRRLLLDAGWGEDQVGWVWPLVAGHHGLFPSLGDLRGHRATNAQLQGSGPGWERAQFAVVEVFTRALGFSGLAEVQPGKTPSRAAQLQVSGLVVMADWIASDQRHFPGIDRLEQVSLGSAESRAAAAWAALGLRGGWGALDVPGPTAFQDRFEQRPRPSQTLVLDVVRRMSGPGLVVVEAPTGEGKTKTAMVAAEILAAGCGADGVFVGMPTQATSDPLFTKAREWLSKVGPDLDGQVALLHGKRRFNKEWQGLLGDRGEDPDEAYVQIAEDEDEDEFGMGGGCCSEDQAERRAPAEWFLGRMRGLLSPFAVGTIDQLLFAATRTKHVMLRVAGLVGKVVILDEVHAADVYMSQFLMEGLRWLGQARVPVVLLSATLPPAQRRALVGAYLAGATTQEKVDLSDLPEPQGYPNVTAAWAQGPDTRFIVADTRSWREDLKVGINVLPEPAAPQVGEGEEEKPSSADAAVVTLLADQLAEGGCALVIRNTVVRAQATYQALRDKFGDEDVWLLHGRLHAEHRADRTEKCLELLGPPGDDRPPRPHRMIVVATQLAEQSFDVDADLLVTDLAPIDLLLQRLGRVHRFAGTWRPERLRTPQVFVTGFDPSGSGAPHILPASKGIYGRYLLLRTAALVVAAEGGHWSVPGQVPHLVAQVYGEDTEVVPTGWSKDERESREDWETDQVRRAQNAKPFLLTRFGEHEQPTLEGLHYGGTRESLKDDQFQALVRDGERSIEVVLVRRGERGFQTLKGRSLGINGDASSELIDEVLGATVRLPSTLTKAAEQELLPLDGWRGHPWLRYSRALILDDRAGTALGDFTVRYDDELGLVVGDGKRSR